METTDTSNIKIILGRNIPLLRVDLNIEISLFRIIKCVQKLGRQFQFYKDIFLKSILICRNATKNKHKYEEHKRNIQANLNLLLKIKVNLHVNFNVFEYLILIPQRYLLENDLKLPKKWV